MEYCGADVLRLNHVGDWGTQFGMLIEHMADARKEAAAAGEGGEAKDEDVADLQELYRAAKKRFDEDKDFQVRAREAVTRLQGGELLLLGGMVCPDSEAMAYSPRLGIAVGGMRSFVAGGASGIVWEFCGFTVPERVPVPERGSSFGAGLRARIALCTIPGTHAARP